MGCVGRLFRKLWKNEKYVMVFLSIFWPSLILWIGCYMLWYAERRYSPVPTMTVEHSPKAGTTSCSEEDSSMTVSVGEIDSVTGGEDTLQNP